MLLSRRIEVAPGRLSTTYQVTSLCLTMQHATRTVQHSCLLYRSGKKFTTYAPLHYSHASASRRCFISLCMSIVKNCRKNHRRIYQMPAFHSWQLTLLTLLAYLLSPHPSQVSRPLQVSISLSISPPLPGKHTTSATAPRRQHIHTNLRILSLPVCSHVHRTTTSFLVRHHIYSLH
jgi:hypothetical protein